MSELFTSIEFPKHLLKRATLRGGEFAWQLDDIPDVIEAIKIAGHINIGGQLQFRLKDGPTCECYEVAVDTQKILETSDQSDLAAISAAEALRQFNEIRNEDEFIARGRAAFANVFDDARATASDLKDAMCFVWYATSRGQEGK